MHIHNCLITIGCHNANVSIICHHTCQYDRSVPEEERNRLNCQVQGTATMTLGEGSNHWITEHGYGETILIPQGTKHRVENKGQDALVFIEVQHGSYFGEDDIVRIEDDYNRK